MRTSVGGLLSALLLVLAAMALSVAPVAGAGEAAPAYPDGCVAWLRVPCIDRGLAQVAQLSLLVSPGDIRGILGERLGRAFQNPDLLGVDRSGSYCLVLLDRERFKRPVLKMVPVADETLFLAGIRKAIARKLASRDGLFAFFIGPEPRENKEAVGRERFVGFGGAYAVCGEEIAAIRHVVELLKAGKWQLPPESGAGADAGLNVARLNDIYGQEIARFVQRTKWQMRVSMRQTLDRPRVKGVPDMSPLVELEIDIARAILAQIADVRLSAASGKDDLRVTWQAVPKPKTRVAQVLRDQGAKNLRLLRRVPPDAIAFAAFGHEQTQAATDLMLSFLAAAHERCTGEALSAERIAALRKELETRAAALGSEVAYVMLPEMREPAGLTICVLRSVRDRRKAEKCILDDIAGRTELAALKKALGRTFDAVAETGESRVGDVRTYRFSLVLRGEPDDQARVAGVKRLLGGSMRMVLAVTDDIAVTAIGGRAEQRLREILAGGTSGAGPWHASANIFMCLAPAQAYALVGALSGTRADDPGRSPGLQFTARAENGLAAGKLVFPGADIARLGRMGVQALQSVEASPGGGGGPQPEKNGAPGPETDDKE